MATNIPTFIWTLLKKIFCDFEIINIEIDFTKINIASMYNSSFDLAQERSCLLKICSVFYILSELRFLFAHLSHVVNHIFYLN